MACLPVCSAHLEPDDGARRYSFSRLIGVSLRGDVGEEEEDVGQDAFECVLLPVLHEAVLLPPGARGDLPGLFTAPPVAQHEDVSLARKRRCRSCRAVQRAASAAAISLGQASADLAAAIARCSRSIFSPGCIEAMRSSFTACIRRGMWPTQP